MKCKETQCPVYIGDDSLSYEQRMFYYIRRSRMMDHVENHYLRHIESGEEVPCMHPKYKPYVIAMYGIALRL
jgi:hypothetical protein